MNEASKPCAEPVTKPEPPRASYMRDLIGALAALAKAQEAQTAQLTLLVESLTTLTENLVTLLDQIEAQNDDDERPRFDTLS